MKKKNDQKIFHASAKLIVRDSDIDEAFESIHQSIMKKIKVILIKVGFSLMYYKVRY